jgi:hypothetical protein
MAIRPFEIGRCFSKAHQNHSSLHPSLVATMFRMNPDFQPTSSGFAGLDAIQIFQEKCLGASTK